MELFYLQLQMITRTNPAVIKLVSLKNKLKLKKILTDFFFVKVTREELASEIASRLK